MKKILLATILFASLTSTAQITPSMRTGYSFKTNDAFIAPALNYTQNNLTVGAEMMINTKDDSPVNFGIKTSYQYSFIEIGVGTWYQLYTTDGKDQDFKNNWAQSVFVAAHWKMFFVQYEYLQQNKLSIGIKENL